MVADLICISEALLHSIERGSYNTQFTYQHIFSGPAPLVLEASVHDSCSSLLIFVPFLSLCHLIAVPISVSQPHLKPVPVPFGVACVFLLRSAQTKTNKLTLHI